MEYCVVRQRGWFEKDGMLAEVRRRIRRVERPKTPKGDVALTRDRWAAMIRDVRSISRRQKATDLRGAATDVTVSDHEDRIETVEEVVHTERKTTRKIDGGEQ
jgi:hypothetical protein